MIIIGIDPGYTGAIAGLDTQTGSLVVQDMPTVPSPKGKVMLDMAELHRFLDPQGRQDIGVVIEKVSAMPRQGVSSTFRFGECFGAIQMAVVAHQLPYQLITPQSWKKHFGLTSNKGTSRGLASQRFPQYSKQFARVKDDGRAEAALLALFGFEKLSWTNSGRV